MNPTLSASFILPDWPAPLRVQALSTTRHAGVSLPPYDSLNLAAHVGDVAAHVAENRRRLRAMAALPAEPAWLEQVHGIAVVAAETVVQPVSADASFTRQLGIPCVVMSADCLPVLFCDVQGTVVAAAHAGWRGLAGGVLEASVAQMGIAPPQLLAWLGPAIGAQAFEVGAEVRAEFLAGAADNAACFRPSPNGRWLADLYGLARIRLRNLGITAIYGGTYCTFSDTARFFSYRRAAHTGRMASLIWLRG